MKKPLFTGVCTALVTPFVDNQINYPMLEQLLDRQMEAAAQTPDVLCQFVGLSVRGGADLYRQHTGAGPTGRVVADLVPVDAQNRDYDTKAEPTGRVRSKMLPVSGQNEGCARFRGPSGRVSADLVPVGAQKDG